MRPAQLLVFDSVDDAPRYPSSLSAAVDIDGLEHGRGVGTGGIKRWPGGGGFISSLPIHWFAVLKGLLLCSFEAFNGDRFEGFMENHVSFRIHTRTPL